MAVTSWSDTQIVAHPVGNCEPGTYTLLVQTDQGPSNSKNFAILPQIDTVSPSTSLRFGDRVTIRGRSFGTTERNLGKVRHCGCRPGVLRLD